MVAWSQNPYPRAIWVFMLLWIAVMLLNHGTTSMSSKKLRYAKENLPGCDVFLAFTVIGLLWFVVVVSVIWFWLCLSRSDCTVVAANVLNFAKLIRAYLSWQTLCICIIIGTDIPNDKAAKRRHLHLARFISAALLSLRRDYPGCQGTCVDVSISII